MVAFLWWFYWEVLICIAANNKMEWFWNQRFLGSNSSSTSYTRWMSMRKVFNFQYMAYSKPASNYKGVIGCLAETYHHPLSCRVSQLIWLVDSCPIIFFTTRKLHSRLKLKGKNIKVSFPNLKGLFLNQEYKSSHVSLSEGSYVLYELR